MIIDNQTLEKSTGHSLNDWEVKGVESICEIIRRVIKKGNLSLKAI